jgi:plastocyanin domain-containing protein
VQTGFRGSGGTGCACCGTQNPSAAGTTGTARLSEGIQEAYIEVNGGYIPETLVVKAGVPLRLTFSKGTSSCDSIIVLPFVNKQIDVRTGEQTVEIPALAPGTYEYYCWMKMLYGRIVAE